MSILIKGGIIAGADRCYAADLLIEEGRIVKIGKIDQGNLVIDAMGMIVFPGFIDAHTHFDMDTGAAHTADDFDTGTRAALIGGTTTIIDFATQSKGETLAEALANWHRKAKDRCSCDYSFHMAITDWNSKVSDEIPQMKEQGVTSFKLYMAYDTLRVNDGEIYDVLKKVKEIEGIVGVHCENGDLVNQLVREQLATHNVSPAAHPLSRPAIVEKEAVGRFLDIAYLAGAPAHIVHLSTQESLEEVKRAKARRQKVWVETCPQYLLLDESYYNLPEFESAKYVLSPPLRSAEDIKALWEGLKQGDIDTISTDHCSFSFKGAKEQGRDDFSQIPCGIPGVEHRPQLIYTYGVRTGKMTVAEMAKLLSTNAAKLFGMYPRKGVLEIGSDGDIVIWNPEYEGRLSAATQIQNVDYTPFEGFRVKGRAEHVFLRGEHVVENGKIVVEKRGQYIGREGTCYPL